MAKPKLTATLPDGTVATRRTDRNYVTVVAVETQNAYYHNEAQARLAREEAREAEAREKANVANPPEHLVDCAREAARWTEQARKAFAKTSPDGTTWAAWSWHSRYDLAAKKVDEIKGHMGRGVYPAIVNIETVPVDPQA